MNNRLNRILNSQDSILKSGRGAGYKRFATFAEIDAIYREADGKCAICGSLRGKRNHALDHCHTTGKLRGVLCTACNQGLGHFKDDESLLQNAIDYLRKYRP